MVQYQVSHVAWSVSATSVSTALRHRLSHHKTTYLYVQIFVFVCIVFIYFYTSLLLLTFFFFNFPDSRKATLCIVKMTNEGDRRNGGFSFVFTWNMVALLCRNCVPTGTSYDSCGAQDCNKINTVCWALRLLFGVTGVYSSINIYE